MFTPCRQNIYEDVPDCGLEDDELNDA